MKRRKAGKKSVSAEGNFIHSFMNELIKETKNPLSSIMEEETLSTTTEYIDTGSFALNGLIVGDIFKGMPNNKTIAFAGEESCGKTYLCLDIVKHAIEAGYIIAYFDSENAVDKIMASDRGIDTSKIIYSPIETVEQFRDELVKLINKYNENTDKRKPKLMVILDSLGNLSTAKEMADVESGSGKKDMTRAAGIKSVFRVLNLKLAKAKVPMIITNHVYDLVGSFIPQKIMGGGSGLKYAASIIIYIYKSKAKDSAGNVCGVYMNCKTVKNRFCKQDSSAKIYLDFNKGLNPYYGLQDFGEPILVNENKATKPKEKKKPIWKLNGKKISDNELWSKDWKEFDGLLELIKENVTKKFAFGNNATNFSDVISGEGAEDEEGEKE